MQLSSLLGFVAVAISFAEAAPSNHFDASNGLVRRSSHEHRNVHPGGVVGQSITRRRQGRRRRALCTPPDLSINNVTPPVEDTPNESTPEEQTSPVEQAPPPQQQEPAPQPQPTPAPAPAPAPAPPQNNAPDGQAQEFLNAHNEARGQHGASSLSWSGDLASKAQQWANGCNFVHSGGSLGPLGENLAAGTADSFTPATAVQRWVDERGEYRASSPVASHFTQVVWKGSSEVGCAKATCNGGLFSGSWSYYVCEYFPAGNVIGRFGTNVQV